MLRIQIYNIVLKLSKNRLHQYYEFKVDAKKLFEIDGS